jgi:hypothetical protein
LNCGAAARTRLASSPRWKAPVVALGVVLVLSLGLLAGSLVKLAGGSSPATTLTTTVTTQASAPASTQPQSLYGTSSTAASVPTTASTPTTTTATTPTSPKSPAVPQTSVPTGTPTTGAKKAAPSLAEDLKKEKLLTPNLKKAVEERLRKAGLSPNSSQ